MVTQRLGSLPQIATRGALQIQADQIDHAVPGFFKFRAQKFGAKVTRNLHHAFGGIRTDHVELLPVDDAGLHAVLQRLFKKRAGVVQRYRREA